MCQPGPKTDAERGTAMQLFMAGSLIALLCNLGCGLEGLVSNNLNATCVEVGKNASSSGSPWEQVCGEGQKNGNKIRDCDGALLGFSLMNDELCERCQGDCDDDGDCAGNLVCSSGGGDVRGCPNGDKGARRTGPAVPRHVRVVGPPHASRPNRHAAIDRAHRWLAAGKTSLFSDDDFCEDPKSRCVACPDLPGSRNMPVRRSGLCAVHTQFVSQHAVPAAQHGVQHGRHRHAHSTLPAELRHGPFRRLRHPDESISKGLSESLLILRNRAPLTESSRTALRELLLRLARIIRQTRRNHLLLLRVPPSPRVPTQDCSIRI